MLNASKITRSCAALGMALVVAFALCACFRAQSAYAAESGQLAAGTALLTAADESSTTADDSATTEGPKVTNDKFTMRVYQKAQIETDSPAKYKSSNKKIATVSKSGLITAKKKGKVTITATSDDEIYIVKITVKKNKFKPVPMKKLKRYKYFRKYMTEAQLKKAYKKALKIVLPLGDLSKKEKLYGVANELRALFDKGMKYSMKAKHYNDPYGYFVKKTASCAGCTRATGLCLNILGINYEHVNENKYSHQWARVKVGKKYWICDAYGLYCGPEPGKRKHPLMP